MITFKIQGAKYELPTAWGDVTYSQYISLLQLPDNLIHHLNLFTQIGLEKLQTAELRNLESIAKALYFIHEPYKPIKGPTRLVGKYYVPSDVTIESLGQFEDLRGLLREYPQDITTQESQLKYADLCLHACAIYVQKIKDGSYDSDKVPEVKEELKKESCVEIIQTGSFFLSKPLHLQTSMRHRFRIVLQRLKKSLVDLPGYRKSLDFLQRSTGSREK